MEVSNNPDSEIDATIDFFARQEFIKYFVPRLKEDNYNYQIHICLLMEKYCIVNNLTFAEYAETLFKLPHTFSILSFKKVIGEILKINYNELFASKSESNLVRDIVKVRYNRDSHIRNYYNFLVYVKYIIENYK